MCIHPFTKTNTHCLSHGWRFDFSYLVSSTCSINTAAWSAIAIIQPLATRYTHPVDRRCLCHASITQGPTGRIHQWWHGFMLLCTMYFSSQERVSEQAKISILLTGESLRWVTAVCKNGNDDIHRTYHEHILILKGCLHYAPKGKELSKRLLGICHGRSPSQCKMYSWQLPEDCWKATASQAHTYPPTTTKQHRWEH